jgi:hypothetical protein
MAEEILKENLETKIDNVESHKGIVIEEERTFNIRKSRKINILDDIAQIQKLLNNVN